MEKVVHLFESFKTIFYLKFFRLGKAIFGTARSPSPTNRRVAYKLCPSLSRPSILSLSSSLASACSSTLSPPSSSCRTHQRPPRPPELRRWLRTPPRRAVFSTHRHRSSLMRTLPPHLARRNRRHSRRSSPMRTLPPHLARRNRHHSRVEYPLSALQLGRQWSHVGRATATSRAHSAGWSRSTEPLCHWARPTVPGFGLKCRPSTVRRFSDF
jgi:hypothetical protein